MYILNTKTTQKPRFFTKISNFNIIIPHNVTTIEEQPTITTNRELVSTYNLLGQIIDENYNGIIIEVYSAG